ncbi:MAG: hypothetical protein KF812_13375 [Fimbriimonadaceae bacterium]|nr:hypothetical protein [Fimbriimonadaceae bacterium]
MLHFRETQRFAIWAEALMLGAGVVMPVALFFLLQDEKDAVYVLTMVPVMLLVYLGFFRMVTEVSDTALRVTFGWIPFYRRTIPLAEIVSAEVITYNPIRDYGGWGIRGIPVQALNARGNRGVKLLMTSGRHLMVGSQIPEDLAQAICAPRS